MFSGQEIPTVLKVMSERTSDGHSVGCPICSWSLLAQGEEGATWVQGAKAGEELLQVLAFHWPLHLCSCSPPPRNLNGILGQWEILLY